MTNPSGQSSRSESDKLVWEINQRAAAILGNKGGSYRAPEEANFFRRVKEHIERLEADLTAIRSEQRDIQKGWPVNASPKGHWQTALYYADYWWVKKSHAERAVDDALERCAAMCQQMARFQNDLHDSGAVKCAESLARNIRALKSGAATVSGERKDT